MYGETLRIPGPFLEQSSQKDIQPFLQRLRRRMNNLRPTPVTRHSNQAVFVHKDLKDSTHVFLRQDAMRRPLQPPYSGPYKVISRADRTFKIAVRGRPVTVSVDRFKPSYSLEEQHSCTRNLHTVPAAPSLPNKTTRSGRKVQFPKRFLTKISFFTVGG